jgi:hypothetical protein
MKTNKVGNIFVPLGKRANEVTAESCKLLFQCECEEQKPKQGCNAQDIAHRKERRRSEEAEGVVITILVFVNVRIFIIDCISSHDCSRRKILDKMSDSQ